MIVIPAIDILDNEAVRLVQGDYSRKTVYSSSPWELVKGFKKTGAELLHLVDLNAARDGESANSASIKKIRDAAEGMRIEIGGGIRSMEKLKYYDSMGMDRMIIGTAAVTEPHFLEQALKELGKNRVVVAVDAKDGIVKIKGWEKETGIHYLDLMKTLTHQGVEHIIFTDISQDGMLTGPNFDSYIQILKEFPFHVVASGGISSIRDIIRFSTIRGVYGVITGKAIYEGKLDLEDAIKNTKEIY